MKFNIVADSSCDLKKKDIDCEEVGFVTVPFSLNVGNEVYVDDEDLNPADLLEAMENCEQASGSGCTLRKDTGNF